MKEKQGLKLRDELKKNSNLVELVGKYNKIVEEINNINIILLGKKGEVELSKLFGTEIGLINEWKKEAEESHNRGLRITQKARTIILDKMFTKDRLYDELQETTEEMFKEVDIIKEKEPEIEYELQEEDEEAINKLMEEFANAEKEGKKVDKWISGKYASIVRWNSKSQELPRLTTIFNEAVKRYKQRIPEKQAENTKSQQKDTDKMANQ